MLAERLAKFATTLRYSDLGAGTVSDMKARIVDAVGCALGAFHEEPARIARDVSVGLRARGQATLMGTSEKVSPELAAFANGLMVRYFDFNDTYLSLEPAHPSDNLSTCFAVAEAEGLSGKELIGAAVSAYEVQCRLCDAADIRHRGWDHVNYGLVSTALAASRLMKLDVEAATNAVGIAVNGHIALRQVRAGELSMWKGASFANAARNGVFSAMLAREGMTGPSPIFEGEMGFFKQVSGPFKLDVEDFGKGKDGFRVSKTYIKYWPAEYHAQTAVWAALELRKKVQDISAIQAVEVETHEAGFTILGKDREKWFPKTKETADHSLPFIVGMALLHGILDNSSYSEANLKSKANLRFIAKVRVKESPDLTALYPKEGMPNRITLVLKGGKKVSSFVQVPRGHPLNPVTRTEIEAKFMKLSAGLLGSAGARKALRNLWRIDQEKNLEELMGCLQA